jgi:hypothetical protein
MKEFLAGIRRWWLRKFRGIVEPPRHFSGMGTTWHQHPSNYVYFLCICGAPANLFEEKNLFIRSRNHHSDTCQQIDCETCKSCNAGTCKCPVTDARYVKICPKCRRGHWKEAIVK